jgi:alpha-ketoglutarate-dependent taurine dioxygenase
VTATHTTTALDLRPLTPVIGAEVFGLDLSQPLDDERIRQVRTALTSHLVLFFPDQDLTPEQQAAFTRQFGELTPAHPVIPALDGHPEVLPIDSRANKSAFWHTDVTYVSTPPLGTVLYMLEMPEVGGDTMWVNLQAAYDALAEPVRGLCDQLVAIHHDPWFAADVEANGGFEWDGAWVDKLYPAAHPVVRTHPETRRAGLFVNSQFTRLILGVSEVESAALLDMLYRHCQRPEFACRYRWHERTVAFWDNRATLHYALDDYGDAVRIVHRVTLRGDRPFGPAMPPPAKD